MNEKTTLREHRKKRPLTRRDKLAGAGILFAGVSAFAGGVLNAETALPQKEIFEVVFEPWMAVALLAAFVRLRKPFEPPKDFVKNLRSSFRVFLRGRRA